MHGEDPRSGLRQLKAAEFLYYRQEKKMLKYNEFIEKVTKAGFWTPYTNYINQETFAFAHDGNNPEGQSYTNGPETDPETWKNRTAQEKNLAYGHFFNGKPGGYIAPRFYSIFIDAFRPRMTVEERFNAGKLGQMEMKIWNLINEKNSPIAISDIYNHYGFRAKEKAREVESAFKCLQMTFDITISGFIEDEYHNGKPNKFTGYDKVDNWVPKEWMAMNPRMEHGEALDVIYRQAEKISNAGDAKKAFRQSLKLYTYS